MINLLTDIVYCTFKNTVGGFQRGKEKEKALLISFKTRINYEIEDGYRYLDVLVHGPSSYVNVFARKRWTIIPLEDMEEDDDGDLVPKVGKDYVEGETPWKLLVCHNSEWLDIGIKQFLINNEKEILSFATNNNWYQIINCPEEILKEY